VTGRCSRNAAYWSTLLQPAPDLDVLSNRWCVAGVARRCHAILLRAGNHLAALRTQHRASWFIRGYCSPAPMIAADHAILSNADDQSFTSMDRAHRARAFVDDSFPIAGSLPQGSKVARHPSAGSSPAPSSR